MAYFTPHQPAEKVIYNERDMYQLIHMNKSKHKPAAFEHNISRYPRLDTVLMVEKALYRHRSDKTVSQIWRALPKKVMWRTYLTILDYLIYSGKILIDKDRTVVWIWNPKLMEKVGREGIEA